MFANEDMMEVADTQGKVGISDFRNLSFYSTQAAKTREWGGGGISYFRVPTLSPHPDGNLAPFPALFI